MPPRQITSIQARSCNPQKGRLSKQIEVARANEITNDWAQSILGLGGGDWGRIKEKSRQRIIRASYMYIHSTYVRGGETK